ncbi:aromatic/alkene monooxygenase hydroxylase subunit beta [Methyloferula stellata]|uniref:aromatic/alkene monooxygenase hydroxylase subunit beta n=1 Tax=Methyloferula stellata TaxID=876270 RepID=UPI000377554D|nr:methane monooxygenase [Methyloferula stellata]
MAIATATTTKRGLTDPERAAKILAAIPDHELDTQRRMNYFVEPRWKRLSEYEILTSYTQPNPDWIAGGLDWGDWTQKFHGGRPSWGNESTELRTTDWFRHRDPARRWHAPYVKDKAEEWRYTTRFLEGYSAEGAVRSIDPKWRDEILAKYWGALLFSEYGQFNAHSSVARDALSDTIRSTATFAALDKVDCAQMIQLERNFLAKVVPGFPESTEGPKNIWLSDPIYKSARTTVEEFWQGIQDFSEILWAVHGVYDPLFGQFARREFFGRMAAHYGDSLTPFFLSQTQTYFQTTKAAMSDLFFYSLGDDPEFGDHNRTWFRAWTEKWLKMTADSLHDFLGIYAKVEKVPGLSDKAGIIAAVSRVVNDWVEDYAKKIDFKVDADQLVASITRDVK